MVGVTIDTERPELGEEDVDTQVEESDEYQMSEREVLGDDDNLVSLDIEELIEDNEACAFEATVEVGGKIVLKARTAKEILNENIDSSYTDRLLRVQS